MNNSRSGRSGGLRALVLLVALGASVTLPGVARAGVFDDDEARKAILDLRDKFNSFQATATDRVEQNTRSLLDLQNQIVQLREELAKLRGQSELQQNDLSQVQKSGKDVYRDLDERLRKLEPQKVMVDGREGLVQPAEKVDFDASLKAFRDGNYKLAFDAFQSFARRYPQSVYLPQAAFWAGNSAYALKDYKSAIGLLQDMIRAFPDHPKVAEAMLVIANSQSESNQRPVAKKTYQELILKFPEAEAAAVAKQRLAAMK